MERMRRSVSFVLLLTLLSGWLAVAPAPEAYAAGKTFTVTKTSDTFADPAETCAPDPNPTGCTLRQALNAAGEPDNAGSTVRFRIPASDPGLSPPGVNRAWIISPIIALPPISQSGTIIDGSTQTDLVGNFNNDGAEIIVNGTAITNTGGLEVSSNDNTIKGIGLANFRGVGAPGQLKGVGIEISGSNNVVTGNYIGLSVNPAGGTSIAPNADAGIIVYGNNNRIGGGNTTQTTEFNVISGNDGDGIQINGGDNNIVAGNYIGTNGAISASIPNKGNGINIRFSGNNNTIGNFEAIDSARYRNYIGGNGAYGISITNSSSNKIYGNFIGLDRSGDLKISNTLGGISINGTSTNTAISNRIGAATPSENMRNYIAGDSGAGIQINGFGARLNSVINNYIGVNFADAVPQGAVSQLQNGLLLTDGASDSTIGGSSASGEGNVIANIAGDALRVSGRDQPGVVIRARNNTIRGNLIGVAPNGITAFRNSGSGIVLDTAVERTTIGGSAAERNISANNAADGLRLTGSKVLSNTVLVNTFRNNTGNGIHLNGPGNTLIAGQGTDRVTITANTLSGIRATSATSTTIRFANSSSNIDHGAYVTGGSATSILTSTASLNGKEGILADGASSKLTIRGTSSVTNTFSGLHLSGTTDVVADNNTLNANQQHGALVDLLATNVDITNSSIFSNTLTGVTVDGSASPKGTQPVEITSNRISGNGVPQNGPFPATPPAGSSGNGIKLVGTTTGSPGSNTGPNHDIDPPFNLRVNNRGRLTGRVRANNLEPSSCLPGDKCRIQVFTTNPQTLDGQGLQQLNVPVTITSNGYFTATLGSVPPQLAVTATDQAGSTSEFAIWTRQYTGLQIGPPRIGTAAPGQTITYTHRITNTSTVDFDDLRLSYNSQLKWTVVPAPEGNIALGVGENKPVTVTITLPTGSVENVRAGLVEQTRVTVQSTGVPTATASVTDTTTVLGRFILSITPPSATGFGVPGKPIDYVHTLTNLGNITGTVSLAPSTTLGGLPAPTWTTSITPAQITLGPGKSATTSVRVNVPPGAQAERDVAVTRTLVTGSATTAITDTTVVTLTQLATMLPPREADAGPGEKVTFEHTVTNLSNGRATFKLSGSSSLGSTLRFRGIPGGATLGPDNSFTLDNRPGTNVFSFLVEITVDPRARRGQSDQVTLSLTDKGGATTFASVQDKINIVRNPEIRTYLPAVYR